MIFLFLGVFLMCGAYFNWYPESELQGMLGYIFCAICTLIGTVQIKFDELIETIKNKG